MAMVGGAYLRDKNTCARTLTENVGELIREGGRICGTLRYSLITNVKPVHPGLVILSHDLFEWLVSLNPVGQGGWGQHC